MKKWIIGGVSLLIAAAAIGSAVIYSKNEEEELKKLILEKDGIEDRLEVISSTPPPWSEEVREEQKVLFDRLFKIRALIRDLKKKGVKTQ